MIDLLEKPKIKFRKAVYSRLKEDIVQAIGAGMLAPGMALPSENLLTQKYNISRSSVRQALQELESEKLIFKKPGKGTFVKDKTLDGINSSLNEVKSIGLDIELARKNGQDWYATKVIEGMTAICNENNCRLVLINKFNLKNNKKGFVDGIISAAIFSDDFADFEKLNDKGIIPVLFNRLTDRENLSYFSVNYRKESEKAVKKLISKGHKNIGLVSGNINNDVDMPRYLGFCDALGCNPDADNLEEYCFVSDDKSDVYYTKCIKKYLEENDFHAIYLMNGCFALPLFSAVAELGIKIPEDLEVLCFDDIEYLYDVYKYPFIYVKMPLKEMGQEVTSYLINKISKGVEVPVKKKLFNAEIIEFGYNN